MSSSANHFSAPESQVGLAVGLRSEAGALKAGGESPLVSLDDFKLHAATVTDSHSRADESIDCVKNGVLPPIHLGDGPVKPHHGGEKQKAHDTGHGGVPHVDAGKVAQVVLKNAHKAPLLGLGPVGIAAIAAPLVIHEIKKHQAEDHHSYGHHEEHKAPYHPNVFGLKHLNPLQKLEKEAKNGPLHNALHKFKI